MKVTDLTVSVYDSKVVNFKKKKNLLILRKIILGIE